MQRHNVSSGVTTNNSCVSLGTLRLSLSCFSLMLTVPANMCGED